MSIDIERLKEGLRSLGHQEHAEAIEALQEQLRTVEADRDHFKLRIETDMQHADMAKSHGVPDWYDHNWPAVLFCNGKWWGVREGYEFNPRYDYKGFPTFDLHREQGAFICYGTYDGDWEKSFTKRPPAFTFGALGKLN